MEARDAGAEARQVQREGCQRDAALGKRARAVLRGDLGPVLKRWANVSVVPVAGKVRTVAEAVSRHSYGEAADALQSPLFGLPGLGESPSLGPILGWCLKGRSPGRGEGSTYADDLVLASLGTAIQALAVSGKPIPLTALLGQMAEASRETVIGQFITQVQGAKAMMRVRKGGKASWKQGKQINEVARLLGGQVRHALAGQGEADDEEVPLGGRSVVSVLTPKGESRRIELRAPEEGDWDTLEVAAHPKGMKDPHKPAWMTFALIVLCAAQAEAGWFDLVKMDTHVSANGTRSRRPKGRAHGVVLSDEAHKAIKGDLDKWMSMGFTQEPMVVPPVDGGYLTVKHRKVAGGRGPKGMRTNVEDTDAWRVATSVMGGTPWHVAGETLRAIREGSAISALAARSEPDEVRRESILNRYAEVAQEPALYMPLMADFRGRIYTRPNLVTYQGTDLQKGLLRFPDNGNNWKRRTDPAAYDAVALHMGALFGGPQKLDKAPLEERREWFYEAETELDLEELCAHADEPIQLYTAMSLFREGYRDSIPCQIDGTCNGLQHLSALFRDETAAPHVNLTASTLEGRPSDIYATVAERVLARLSLIQEPWAQRLRAAIRIDRKLCKKPVMVLPYGGTRTTIEDAVLGAILEQDPDARYWTEGRDFQAEPGIWTGRWPDWLEGNYAAFKDRDLKDHPLLHLDAKRLGGIVWDCIVAVLPRAMAAMETFRAIAKAVGPRSLEWDTGTMTVVQAKAKSDRTRLNMRGFHLPGSIRGLAMQVGRDDIDPGSHTSSIVANFIHSQDAAHQTFTMERFGEPCFGGIFDCYITRPSKMARLGDCTRQAFCEQYFGSVEPLTRPVLIRDGEGKAETFRSWYDLAHDVGVSFPEPGKWEPREVLESAWFFS